MRDETKFDRMTAFAKQLPALRRRVRRDRARRGLPREKVVATEWGHRRSSAVPSALQIRYQREPW